MLDVIKEQVHRQCTHMINLIHTSGLGERFANKVRFNPLITNDAYMRQIIACAEVPMTHICVKDEGAHFHGIFGCCERATALSSSQPIQ